MRASLETVDSCARIRGPLAQQFRASLGMLAGCVERCPDDLWANPDPAFDDGDRIIHRAFWRIAFHAVYFTHLYLGQGEDSFQPPPAESAVRRAESEGMWSPPWILEPYEMPVQTAPFSKHDILEYIAFVDGLVDRTIDSLNLEAEETGFRWYKSMSKLSHELMNLRHLQGHVGQLSEHLLARGIDPDWKARA